MRLPVAGCRLSVNPALVHRTPRLSTANRQPATGNRQPLLRIGVDAGGTLTDFAVLHEDGRLESFKMRSNPAAPAKVILEGIRRATGGGRAEVVHGSTVATNALLERKGAPTAFVTTDGFTDL